MFSLIPCLGLLNTAEEQEAFYAFYQRYHRLVLYRAKQIVGKEDWAEDVMQDVFLYAAEHFGQFSSGSRYHTARLLVLCTASRACDFMRKERKEQGVQEKTADEARAFVHLVDEELDRECVLLQRERIEQMMQVIAGLPEQYRVPLELKMKEYTNREISELLGISMQTLYKRLQRAYAAVRVEMEADTWER